MKHIFFILTILYLVPAFAMEAENSKSRKSCSPGPSRDKILHHVRSHSFSDKMKIMLNLKTDESRFSVTSNVAALISDRSSSEPRIKPREKESPKKSKLSGQISKAESASSSPRKSVKLNLRIPDETKSEPVLTAVDRSSPVSGYSSSEKESPKKSNISEKLAKSDSRNSSPRKLENNKNAYAKALLLAYAALRKIKTAEDAHGIMECQQYINNARFFNIQFMQIELSNVYSQWIEHVVDDEIRPLQEELDTKIASLKEAHKK